MMLTEQQILQTLDNSNDGYYCRFVKLDDPYSFLIDSRVNVFRSDLGLWAIAIERLAFNCSTKLIELEIYYFGNCLVNLETIKDRPSNKYVVYPVNENSYKESSDGWSLKPDAREWLIRNKSVSLQYRNEDYKKAGIKLKSEEYSVEGIWIYEAGRLLMKSYRSLFLTTDEELYRSIPQNLKKIMVLDEWYHRDFEFDPRPPITTEALKDIYDFHKKKWPRWSMDFESLLQITRMQEQRYEEANQVHWNNTRPSLCETWVMLAGVIVHNDLSLYKPTQQPNSHWKNYPYSGWL